MTTSFSSASIHPEEAPHSPSAPPAPWMPLGPLTELWAAFSKEATSREALLAAREAFAALAAEREAIYNLNWLAPAWLRPFPQERTASNTASFSLFVAQEAIMEALSRAASHWYEAALALVEQLGLPPSNERDEQAGSPELDLATLIGYTLSQRVRVWAIAHSLLAEQLQRLFPPQEQGGEVALSMTSTTAHRMKGDTQEAPLCFLAGRPQRSKSGPRARGTPRNQNLPTGRDTPSASTPPTTRITRIRLKWTGQTIQMHQRAAVPVRSAMLSLPGARLSTSN